MLSLINQQQLEPEVALALAVGVQFLMTLVVLGLQIWRYLRKDPPLHEVYATKKELEVLRTDMADRFARLEGRIDQNATADEARSVALHERVNLILSAVSRIEGACRARGNKGGCES